MHTGCVVLRAVLSPEFQFRQCALEQAGEVRLLAHRCTRVERRQGERVIEVMGRFDRRRPRGAQHWLRQARGIQSFGITTVQEGQNLLHDPMEDDAATER